MNGEENIKCSHLYKFFRTVSFLVAAELPCGFFDFDLEESNIDQRVVYFNKDEETD